VSKRWNRLETWLTLFAAGMSVVLMVLLGLFGYMITTAPLHPEPDRVPSVSRSDPTPGWAGTAERGHQVMRKALLEQNLPGLSVAVAVDDDVVWAEGVGWADLEKRVPVAPETRFRIGTASIALTSAAVGLLLEQGRLKLDDEIQTYVPAFPRQPQPVTLRQLMGHRSGVRNDGGDEGPLFTVHCERPVDALEHFADRPLLFEPGTGFHFSSYGWIVVSAAVEAVAGEPVLDFMRRQVFEPLGMDDTIADSATTPVADRATPYFPRFAADPKYGQHLMRPIDLSCYAGASVFVSTASDLARFGIAINRGRLLQPVTVQTLQTSQRLASGQETGYGLGWNLETVTLANQRARVVGHDGDVLGGRVASLMMFPERGLAVVVLSNISYADTFTVGSKIAAAFVEEASRPDR
jgi:CubicO group peptidase (beta-lactamase class C family)